MNSVLLLQFIVLIAAAVVIARAEPALNRMGRHTPILVRVSFHLLTVGAAAEIVFVLAGHVPDWHSAITTVGIATLLMCERRLRIFIPTRRGLS